LSDDFASTTNLLPFECVDGWFQKILHTTAIIKQDPTFGVVARNANTAVCILMEVFRQLDEPFQQDVFTFLSQQTALHSQNWPYEADTNLLRLILKVIDLANHDACALLASSLFTYRSRLWSYRFLHSNAVESSDSPSFHSLTLSPSFS
jgi:hypothetical protein